MYIYIIYIFYILYKYIIYIIIIYVINNIYITLIYILYIRRSVFFKDKQMSWQWRNQDFVLKIYIGIEQNWINTIQQAIIDNIVMLVSDKTYLFCIVSMSCSVIAAAQQTELFIPWLESCVTP